MLQMTEKSNFVEKSPDIHSVSDFIQYQVLKGCDDNQKVIKLDLCIPNLPICGVT